MNILLETKKISEECEALSKQITDLTKDLQFKLNGLRILTLFEDDNVEDTWFELYEQLERKFNYYGIQGFEHMEITEDPKNDHRWYLYTLREKSNPNNIIYAGITKSPVARNRDHFNRRPNPKHGCGYFFGLQDQLFMRVEENLGHISKAEAMALEASYKDAQGLQSGELSNRRLTLRQVDTIRAEFLDGNVSVPKLAKRFNVNTRTIYKLLKGNTYRY